MDSFKSRLMGVRIIFLFIATVLVSSCASSSNEKITDPKDKNVALIYGYINMNEAKARLSWLNLRRYRPSAKRYPTGISDGIFFQTDGIFFHLGVEPGSYQVERFGSNAHSGHYYTFGSSGKNQTAIKIEKPGIYYMGSYKYINEKDRWGEDKKFTVKKTKEPTEKQLLTALLKHVKYHHSEYTLQIKWIEQRLAKL